MADKVLAMLLDILDAALKDLDDVKIRMRTLEASSASMSLRLDRLGVDVDRIKRRLDLVDETA